MTSSMKAFIAAVLVAVAPAAMAGEIGQIKTVKGAVVIVRGGQELRATSGAPLQQADHVVTRADAAAGITFADNSMISLGPDSELDISRFSFGAKTEPDALEATLHHGTLSAVSGKIVAKSPEAMKIRTPTTILGVRGTEFFVQVVNPDTGK